MIEIDVDLRLQDFRLEAKLSMPGHGITALFGPSGSGKSTLLRCLAGLHRPPHGTLTLNGEVWQDAYTFLPPHRRPIGMVFQDAALFPHLNVKQNLEYGARRSHAPDTNAAKLIDLLGIGHLLNRHTETLSGGEKQRVAIARALFSAPKLLLMDEPLAALDAQRKKELLPYLEELHQQLDIPVVYVTHAPEEVAQLADHIVQLAEGKIIRSGLATDVLPHLLALSMHDEDVFTLMEGTIELQDNHDYLTQVSIGSSRLWLRHIDKPIGTQVRLRLLARDISLSLDPSQKASSILNTLRTEVLALEETAPGRTLVSLALDNGPVLLSRITTRSARALKLMPGMTVYANIKGVAPVS